MSITFYTQSKKATVSIYVRIREGTIDVEKGKKGIDAKARTLLVVNSNDFSKGKTKIRKIPTYSDAREKEIIQEHNTSLIKLQEAMDDLRSRLSAELNQRKDYEIINSQWLKEFITPKKKDELPTTLSGYFEFYLNAQKTSLKPSTVKKIKVFHARVLNYEKDNGVRYIQEVNKKFSLSMQKWCDRNNYAHNTKVKTLKVILTICNHAKEHGVITSPELEFITKGLKYQKTEHIHLTFDELKQINNINIENSKLDAARDWLVISCYTAQRVSDFLRFTKNDVVTMNKIIFLDISQDKTEKPVYIPLHDIVVEILNKRNGNFPPLFSKNAESNKTLYNKLIKEVCRLAKIDDMVFSNMKDPITNRYESKEAPKHKAVSTHIGRRSFATNYYGKINTALLISATGHASEEQFLRYVGKTGTHNAFSLANEMQKLAMAEDKEPKLRVVKSVVNE